MRVDVWRDTSRANWVDYAICWLSSALAVYSCGQAVNSNLVSMVGLGGVTLGMLLSYLIRVKFEGKKFLKVDGYLYAVCVWAAFMTAKMINQSLFPEDTFPPELTPSAWLMWMTIFGTFFCWRDATLIFQSIPALGMFGFVGCYDTFRPVVFFFFIFLLCFATLFARAHGRDMQARAIESGFFGAGQNQQFNGYEQSTTLRRGPWRWAAGAEWALGSALAIVVLSLIGAPVIQATAKPLSGIVSVRPPRLKQNTPGGSVQQVPSSAQVGTGPVSLSDTPVYEMGGQVPEYVRIAFFGTWSGHTWSPSLTSDRAIIDRMTGERIGDETDEQFDQFRYPNKLPGQYPDEYRNQVSKPIKALVLTREVLQAGNNPNFSCGRPVDSRAPNLVLMSADRYEGSLSYDKVPTLATTSTVPAKIDSVLNAYLDSVEATGPIKELTMQVTKGVEGDYNKAMAIKEEIARRIKYNTKVDSTPDGKDAAEYALFERHEGYCDVFATSMVRMARILRIPARYAVGYLPDPKNRTNQQTQILLESDRHAWAELYFDKAGWVVFDATEGAEVVPGGGRHDNKPADTMAILRALGIVLDVLIVAALVVGVVLFLRLRTIPKSANVIRNELDVEYLKFIGAIWKVTGHRRLLSETTAEYLRRVGPDLGALQPDADQVGVEFTNVMFGREDITTEQVASMRSTVQHFRDRLNAQQKAAGKRKPGPAVPSA